MYCIMITMAFIISNYSIFCKRDDQYAARGGGGIVQCNGIPQPNTHYQIIIT